MTNAKQKRLATPVDDTDRIAEDEFECTVWKHIEFDDVESELENNLEYIEGEDEDGGYYLKHGDKILAVTIEEIGTQDEAPK